jgi:hypothetical protein
LKIERDLKPRELFLTAVLSACVSRSPERIKAIIVQNASAHEQGLGPAWDKAFWKDRAAYEDKVIPASSRLRAPRCGTSVRRRVPSDTIPRRGRGHIWAQPGQRQIQSDLF